MVVDGKFWRGSAALLESVGAHEPHVNQMRESIRYYIRQAIIPLMAYARQYEPHQALINLVTQDYTRWCEQTDAHTHTHTHAYPHACMHARMHTHTLNIHTHTLNTHLYTYVCNTHIHIHTTLYCYSEFGSTEKTVNQIRAEIDMQLKEKENIEKTLPQNIVIGPFYVNCDTIRQALSRKRKELANALLEYVVSRLKKKSEKVSAPLFVHALLL